MNLYTLFRASAPLLPPPRSTSSSRSARAFFQLGNSSNRKFSFEFAVAFCLLSLWFSYWYTALCNIRTGATENFSIEGRNLNFSITTRQGNYVPILRDCSLRIPSGQFWMLLGPNGCGKSTLLKVHQNFYHASVPYLF